MIESEKLFRLASDYAQANRKLKSAKNSRALAQTAEQDAEREVERSKQVLDEYLKNEKES